MNYRITSADSSVGSSYDIFHEVEDELWNLVSASAEGKYENGSCEKVLSDACRQCEEFYRTKTSSAAEVFQRTAQMINDIKSREKAFEVMKYLCENYGITPVLDAEIKYNYFSGEDYALYLDRKREIFGQSLEDIYKFNDSRIAVRNYAADVLVAAGENPETARERAKAFTCYAIDIALNTDFEAMKSSNPYIEFEFCKNEDLKDFSDFINESVLESVYGIENPYGGWYVGDSGQFKAAAKIFDEERLDELKVYLLCEFVWNYRQFLSFDYPQLGDSEETEKADTRDIALHFAENYLSSQLSEAYAKHYYTPEMDALLSKMQSDITTSYRELISGAEWLGSETRAMLLKKLENMYFVSGNGNLITAPEDNSSLIGSDIFDTAVRCCVKTLEIQKRNIGKKIDKSTSIMSSYEVNAAYSPVNTFTITPGFMHGTNFDINASYEENLGGMGMVIGHEMGHAFDSNCLDFDENGKYDPDRICQADKNELKRRCEKIEDYYSEYSVMDIYYVDGKRTSGENYADLGAMECLENIVKDKDGRRKMFRQYAKNWCELNDTSHVTDEIARDEHSPAVIRVNAVLSSMNGFCEAYNLNSGDGMYVAPEKRVSRWH